MQHNIISVIVPIYKVEKYLPKCIDSIMNQTYKNLEIILVDDGSPDRCGQICDKYAKKDSRIKVIHKQNGGLSDARNAGIDIASGEYICFLDGDDYIAPNMYEKLYSAIKKNNADISICNFYYVDENGRMIDKENIELPIQNEYISGRQVLEEKLAEFKRHYWVVAWNKLYKREIFESCKYPVGKIHEDEYVLPMIYEGKNIECISDCLLYYVQRQGSIMSKPNARHYMDSIDAMVKLGEYYCINGYNDEALTANFRLTDMYIRGGYIEGAYTKKQNKDNIRRYKKILLKILKRNVNIKIKIHIMLRVVDPYCRVLKLYSKLKTGL